MYNKFEKEKLVIGSPVLPKKTDEIWQWPEGEFMKIWVLNQGRENSCHSHVNLTWYIEVLGLMVTLDEDDVNHRGDTRIKFFRGVKRPEWANDSYEGQPYDEYSSDFSRCYNSRECRGLRWPIRVLHALVAAGEVPENQGTIITEEIYSDNSSIGYLYTEVNFSKGGPSTWIFVDADALEKERQQKALSKKINDLENKRASLWWALEDRIQFLKKGEKPRKYWDRKEMYRLTRQWYKTKMELASYRMS